MHEMSFNVTNFGCGRDGSTLRSRTPSRCNSGREHIQSINVVSLSDDRSSDCSRSVRNAAVGAANELRTRMQRRGSIRRYRDVTLLDGRLSSSLVDWEHKNR